jgi:LuxR family transcriptional regulator, maltose regulon positive regulatory protein
MAKMTPLVRGDRLIYQQDEHEQMLAVETPAWFAWLATASTFAFTSDTGTFTARKERTGNQRGGWYWKAYRTEHGKHFSLYLGKSEALTLERLNAVAQALAHTSSRDAGGTASVEGSSSPTEEAKRRTMAKTPADPLLATKLHVPRPPMPLVLRPHLVERLKPVVERQLTLIAAPAGFGKTTLLSAWLQDVPVSSAWVSLDSGDDDPTRFWSYTLAALDAVHSGLGAIGLPLLQSPQPPPLEIILTAVINSLTALPEEVVLVFDDYHVITAQPIHASLAFLLDHLPARLHFVIATRADPPLPLARLRTKGQLVEIRSTDLRFTREEATSFLTQTSGLEFSNEDITALETRTEGWIAGLQLAALSMQGREDISHFMQAFTGTHRFVVDYLTQEVLTLQPEDVQRFLLQTAILERLCGSLCEAVVGEPEGQAMLERLEQANLFLLPLDDERQWYRYHQLFAEMLRQRLHTLQPDRVARLHQRASAWYAQHDLMREAVHHALASADFEQAARLIEHTAEMMAKRGEIATLRTWLETLPHELVRSRVELCLWQGWLLALTGQYEVAEQLLQNLECRLPTSMNSSPLPSTSSSAKPPRLDEAQRLIEYAGRVAATRAFIAFRRGDAPRTIYLALQALEQLPEDQSFRGLVAWYLGIAYLWSGDLAKGSASLTEARVSSQAAGNSYAAFMATFELAQMQARQAGHLHQADQSYRQALELVAERGGLLAATGPAYVGRGELQYEWNNLDTASHFLQEGIAQCQQTGNAVIMLLGHIALARIKQAQGDASGAYTLIQRIEQILRTYSLSPHNVLLLEAWHARLSLQQGDLALASRWVQERKLSIDDELSPSREREYLTLARVLIAQHRPDEALQLLERLLHLAERQERMGSALEILVLQAMAQQTHGDEVGGVERLSRALSLAEPEGYIRLFVDEGAPMAHLLLQMRRRPPGNQPYSMDYREQLLAELAKAPDEDVPAASGSGIYSLSEPLSERELEVLRLIIAGYSNREIANRLVIAVSTVKWYVNTIYSKLQVESRTKAIARARELHIL